MSNLLYYNILYYILYKLNLFSYYNTYFQNNSVEKSKANKYIPLF